jgi:hypothetical protein
MRRPVRALLVLLVLAVAASLCAQAARADGDPASDFLVLSPYFTPFQPAPPKSLRDALGNTLVAAKKGGYPIRVAVIGSKADLGAVPQLFGKPKIYARFLGSELKYAYKGRLLVVMPDGFGTNNVPSREARALTGLRVNDPSSSGLVQTSLAAVRRLAAASGHPVADVAPVPASDSGGSGGGSSPWVVVIGIAGLAAMLIAGGALIWMRRKPVT